MALEVEVDPGLCIGAQRCVYLAPEIFEMGEDGFAHVRAGSGADLDEKVIQVARQCPNYAILVRRDGEVIVGEDVL
jgi:ferredoxin